jgi:hypothetical protein
MIERTRSGFVAASMAFVPPPARKPNNTGRREPTASSAPRVSATAVSRFGGETLRLDRPVPRRSLEDHARVRGDLPPQSPRAGLDIDERVDVPHPVKLPIAETDGRLPAFRNCSRVVRP